MIPMLLVVGSLVPASDSPDLSAAPSRRSTIVFGIKTCNEIQLQAGFVAPLFGSSESTDPIEFSAGFAADDTMGSTVDVRDLIRPGMTPHEVQRLLGKPSEEVRIVFWGKVEMDTRHEKYKTVGMEVNYSREKVIWLKRTKPL